MKEVIPTIARLTVSLVGLTVLTLSTKFLERIGVLDK